LSQSYPSELSYPAGKNVALLTAIELEAMHSIKDMLPVTFESIDSARHDLGNHDGYRIITFGVRVAIYAVRQSAASFIPVSVLCLLVAEKRADWRDILVTSALVDRCAQEVDVRFEDCYREVIADAQGSPTIVDKYIGRRSTMKTIDVMGYRVIGAGSSFMFEPM
jgi:hypothetical protein